MVYRDDTSQWRKHLGLPLESLQEMAARMARRPTSVEQEAIVKAVKRRGAGRKVSPSRIKADLQRERIDVTVEQVAWVMVNVMGIR